MPEPEKNQSSFPGLAVGILVAVLLAGGATAWWAFQSLKPSPSPPAPITNQPQPEPESAPPLVEKSVPVYWLNAETNSLELRPSNITIQKSAQPEAVIDSAFSHLLAGPSDGQAYSTTIPEGTKLLGVDVEKDGVHINLSPEFTAGGGSTSMMGRLGQIVYTATSLDPDTKVWIDINGKPLEVLGGEGILVEQPMTREIFEANFPL